MSKFSKEELIEKLNEVDVHRVTGSPDNVQHPSHYTHGKYETIDVIEDITSGYEDGFTAHCVGTAVKYLYRAPHKHESPLEDLRKARQYVEFAVNRETKREEENEKGMI